MASKGKILVVDDDRLVLATVVHGLMQAGFEVIDADNGDDAILLARQHKPGMALLDIRMDGKSGFDVAEYLRDVLRIPFMFLSAFSDAATLAQVKALGAVAYMVKPLDVGQIVPTVEAAMARLAHEHANHAASQMAVSDDAATLLKGMAVGVLMHRYSLSRQHALERLQSMAQEAGRSLGAQAEQVLSSLEELVRSPAT